MSDRDPPDDEPSEDEEIERTRTEDTMTEIADETDDTGTDERPQRADDTGRDLRRTLNYVLLAGLSLVALIATLQLYFNVSTAINQWVSQEYRPLFQAAFSLAVLLLVGSAMVWQVRRLQE
ncbi:hypothetical protein B4589_004780 [Halolamina sp. CBA1230]|uniref:hypothetical protein n=1 Tax=Halolamina sp. CBA1230 TaxID=1853690 RepID=UPI0009A23089|nr:hypothetical protein [Halolamina sp. CBA1230]QKY19728.1 hypothetical protein B4589_004780 [Halolamina sp. CBA1230]